MKPHYSNTNNPIDFPKSKNKMNERIEHCLYQAGLTAQGCWDELDDYARQGIEKFAELIVQECIHALWTEECRTNAMTQAEYERGGNRIHKHFWS